MRKFIYYLLMLSFSISTAQTTAIPDPIFEQALIDLGIDSGAIDGAVLTANIDTLIVLDLGNYILSGIDNSFSDLTGIEDFIALETLYCDSTSLSSLDLSANTNLTTLHCSSPILSNINLSANTALKTLSCSSSSLINMDLSNNTALENLSCSLSSLTSLDLSNNKALKTLYWSTSLTSLDLSENTALTYLNCALNNNLSSIDLSNNVVLETLYCHSTSLTSLDLSTNIALTYLNCAANDNLIDLDLSANVALTYLNSAANNNLASLNIKNGNNINIPKHSFIVSYNPNLTCIQVDDVVYSNTNWTIKDATATYSSDCSLSILEEEIINYRFYPNPVKDVLNIELNKGLELKQINIYNIQSQYLYSIKTSKIDLSNLSSGMYFIEVETNKGKSAKKIVVE